MSETTIRIPTPLRSYVGGESEVAVQGSTVGEALEALGRRHDGLLERVLDDEGEVRRFVNLYVDDRNVESLDGLETRLSNGAVVSIVPAVAGGAR